MAKIMVIPDTQIKPGESYEHMRWAGLYAVEKRPDYIVHIGDHYDMPSLSSYDKGKRGFEGRRVVADLQAGHDAMEVFLEPIRAEQERRARGKRKKWNPELHFAIGNHEYRIERAVECQPELEGLISLDDLGLEEMGWTVHPFLEVFTLEGIAFAHYFTSGVMGRPVSSARLLLTKKMMSCVMGHVQDRDIAYARRADGRQMTGLFAGIYYQHDEAYLTPQTNTSWRGLWLLHEAHDGGFDELPVSLEFLRQKYEGK